MRLTKARLAYQSTSAVIPPSLALLWNSDSVCARVSIRPSHRQTQNPKRPSQQLRLYSFERWCHWFLQKVNWWRLVLQTACLRILNSLAWKQVRKTRTRYLSWAGLSFRQLLLCHLGLLNWAHLNHNFYELTIQPIRLLLSWTSTKLPLQKDSTLTKPSSQLRWVTKLVTVKLKLS